jgi:uncharacterized protein (DUF2236 family)
MLVTRSDLEASFMTLRRQIPDPRAGILGPRSIAWQLGGELVVFLGGGRAALLQLAHPFVAYAIAQHSHTRADVAGRFRRTFRSVFAMVFGDLDDAFAAARRVHAVHSAIHGTIPEAVGGWPAGAHYHANDADALRWVHATLVDTTLVVRELLDGPLPAAIRDGYVIEMNRFAALFGIPEALWPASHAAHAAYLDAMLASDRLAVAPCARSMARFLVGRDRDRQPALGRIAEAVTALLLPTGLAAQFALRGTPRRARVGLDAFGAVYRRVPRAARRIPARAAAERRLDGLPPSRIGAWAERRLFGIARHTAGT